MLGRSETKTQAEEEEMIVPGQTVENPVTGERLTFHETARETGGEYVRFEALIAPGGTLASALLHPYQSERFQPVSCSLTMKVGPRRLEAMTADVVDVDHGNAYYFDK